MSCTQTRDKIKTTTLIHLVSPGNPNSFFLQETPIPRGTPPKPTFPWDNSATSPNSHCLTHMGGLCSLLELLVHTEPTAAAAPKGLFDHFPA